MNPILPVVAELVLRGCEVRYYLSKAIDRDRPVADPGVFEALETMGQCDKGYNGSGQIITTSLVSLTGIMVYVREIIPKWPQDSGW